MSILVNLIVSVNLSSNIYLTKPSKPVSQEILVAVDLFVQVMFVKVEVALFQANLFFQMMFAQVNLFVQVMLFQVNSFV